MAKADYYLKIDGVDCESNSAQFKQHIEINSFSWGEKQAISTHAVGGHGAGKVEMEHFSFSKYVTKASAKLLLACATGEHIKKAVLHCCKAGGGTTGTAHQQEYLTITLHDILVASFNLGGHEGSSVTENCSLAYSKIEFAYKEQKPDGTVGGSSGAIYDLKQQKAG
jgi:type VI secretion system secreted protein Hcp